MLELESQNFLKSPQLLGTLEFGAMCLDIGECSLNMYCDLTAFLPTCTCDPGFNAIYSVSTGKFQCSKFKMIFIVYA